MTVGITNIIGIDKDTSVELKKNSITTVKQLYDKTRTSKDREELSRTTGYSLSNIESWAVQAELLRNTNMTPEDAFDFIRAGIYSVEEIKQMDSQQLLSRVLKVNKNSLLDLKQIQVLKESRIRDALVFDIDHGHFRPILIGDGATGQSDVIQDDNNSEPLAGSDDMSVAESLDESFSIYSNLSDIVAELGKGIAQAQHQLDLNSLEVQKQILNDPSLASMGLTATWYAMPEIDFELKMEYIVTEKKTEKENLSKGRIKILPHNATYNNIFNTTGSQESSLRLKFVPVPAPVKEIETITMPNLIGLSREEAEEILKANLIVNYEFVVENVETTNYEEGKVIDQSIVAGEVFFAYERLVISIKGSDASV